MDFCYSDFFFLYSFSKCVSVPNFFGGQNVWMVRYLLQFMVNSEGWNYDWLCNYFVKLFKIKTFTRLRLSTKNMLKIPLKRHKFVLREKKQRNIDGPIEIDLLNKNADWICKFIESIFCRHWHFLRLKK